MKVKNWELVEESRPGAMLPPGGYVCRITDVEDVADKEYLWVVYDVAEGEHAGAYANMAPSDAWKHRFTRSYKDSAEGMFRAFLARLEESNRSFKVAEWTASCDERALVGLEVGLLFQTELYTSNKGDDKERTVVAGVVAAQDVRNGDFRLPAPEDRRKDPDETRRPAPDDWRWQPEEYAPRTPDDRRGQPALYSDVPF